MFASCVLVGIINLIIGFGTSSAGDVSVSLNIAAIHAEKAGYDFPAVLEGSDIRAQLPGTQYIFLVHTAELRNGDVIMINNNTLREDKTGNLKDDGVDCQLSISLSEDTETIDVAGLCNFFLIKKGGAELKSQGIIPSTTLAAPLYWILLHEDSKTGIAIYAEVD